MHDRHESALSHANQCCQLEEAMELFERFGYQQEARDATKMLDRIRVRTQTLTNPNLGRTLRVRTQDTMLRDLNPKSVCKDLSQMSSFTPGD